MTSIPQIIDYLKSQPIRISVFGEFSSGKTTFLNGLIGEAILSVAVDPTTAVPTYIRYAREFNILVHLHNGSILKLFEDTPPFWARFVGRESVLGTLKKQEADIRDFLKVWTKEGERAKEVLNIAIDLPVPWLKNNIELVDTPGTNVEFAHHQKYTEQVAEETDIALFLMDARQGGGKRTEFDFMNNVQKGVSHSFVIVNKMDLVDAEDGERSDILEFIIEEAIPKHWQGVLQPKVFGISSIIRLNNKLALDEPELLQEYERLIEAIEVTAIQERGKILLNRINNPEKELFEQASNYEFENKHELAHKIYYDLFDILTIAEINVTPAQDGIDRCESVLKQHLNSLNTINDEMMIAQSMEQDDPDKALKKLREMQSKLKNINAPDQDLNQSISKLSKRISNRDIAKVHIDKCEKDAKVAKKGEDFILAAKHIEGISGYIKDAELPPDRLKSLQSYKNELIRSRNDNARLHWKNIQERATSYFTDHHFDSAEALKPRIMRYSPYLSIPEQNRSKTLIQKIGDEKEKWDNYAKLFKGLTHSVVTLFKRSQIDSSQIIAILPKFKALKHLAKHFDLISESLPRLQIRRNTTLTFDEQLQTVQHLHNYRGKFGSKGLDSILGRLNKKASTDTRSKWISHQKDIKVYKENHRYRAAVTLLQDFEKSTIYLTDQELTNFQILLQQISKDLEKWNSYRKLFETLSAKIIKLFHTAPIKSTSLLSLIEDFKQLEAYSKLFNFSSPQLPELVFQADSFLDINEQLEAIQFLLNYKGKSNSERLDSLVDELVKKRAPEAELQWSEIQARAEIYINDHLYNDAIAILPEINNLIPYLSKQTVDKSEIFIRDINTIKDQWDNYSHLFETLKSTVVELFYTTPVNSEPIIQLLPNLKQLEQYSKRFKFHPSPPPKLKIKRSTNLSNHTQILIVDYLLTCKGVFDSSSIGLLRKRLIQSKDPLKSIPVFSNLKYHVFIGLAAIVLFLVLGGSNYYLHKQMFLQFVLLRGNQQPENITEFLPNIHDLYHGYWFGHDTKQILKNNPTLTPILESIDKSKGRFLYASNVDKLLQLISKKQLDAGFINASIKTAEQIRIAGHKSQAMKVILSRAKQLGINLEEN